MSSPSHSPGPIDEEHESERRASPPRSPVHADDTTTNGEDSKQNEERQALKKQYENVPFYSLHISSIPKDVNDDEFYEVFSKFGTMYDAVTVKDRSTRQSKGFGFVHYIEEDVYKRVLGETIEIKGQKVRISPAEDKTRIFVSRYPRSLDEQGLREKIENATGPFVSLAYKGAYSFVKYANFKLAEKAINKLTRTEISGSFFQAELANSRSTDGAAVEYAYSNLYIRNINDQTTVAQFREAFSKFGPLRDVRVPRSEDNNRNRGYAFVEFENDNDAKQAKSALDNTDFDGRVINIEFQKAGQDNNRRGRDRNSGRTGGSGPDRYGMSRGMPRGPMIPGYPPYPYPYPVDPYDRSASGGASGSGDRRGRSGRDDPYAAAYANPYGYAAAYGYPPTPYGAPAPAPAAGGRTSSRGGAGAGAVPPAYPGYPPFPGAYGADRYDPSSYGYDERSRSPKRSSHSRRDRSRSRERRY